MRISDLSSDVCSSDLHAGALSDRLHVKPQSVCDPLPWHPAIDRTLDHSVFLDRGQPVDPLVVGVGIVVGGHETFDLGDPEIFEHLNPQMAIEEGRSEEHTSELQSLMRISYAVFCLKKKKTYNK